MSSPTTLLATGFSDSPNLRAETAVCVHTRKLPGFQVSEKEYPAGLTLTHHRHDTALLIYGLEGGYLENYAGARPMVCEPGVLRYLPRGLGHSNVFEGGARCLIVEIEREMLERIGRHTKTLDDPGAIRTPASVWLGQRLYSEFRRDDELSLISMEGILLEILADGGRYLGASGRRAAPRWLRLAHEYVESNFLRSISLAEIARVAGVHRVHLAREFRRYFSTTVGELLRRRRVEHACRLVSTTQDSLADVAIACGFSDQSHFCATFRHQIGVTPGRFREMVQSR